MLRNYIKVALRQMKSNKGFSLLNMFGLSLGLTCAILILLWIQDETGYNSFQVKYDNLYQVLEHQTYEDKTYTFAATPGLLASAMKAELPEVKKEDVKVTVENGTLTIEGERKFEKEEKNKKYHRVERAYGQFTRAFTLPETADPTKINAEFKDGMLTVHLTKTEKAQPKAVEVKVT